jgi:hypothetical protein
VKALKATLSACVRGWSRFWFESDGRAQVAAFRVGFGLLLLGCYLVRTLDLELFYGDHGIMPLSILGDVAPMDYRFSVFRIFTSYQAVWIGNALYLTSLLALALGYFPRVAVLVAWLLHVSFVHRNLSIAYGVDMISCFFLLFLCFADFRDDRRYRPGDLQATLGSMAYRLCQIQVCIIYGYSGLKKLKGVLWWNGEAIWNSMADPQLARWDFSWAAHFPLALAAAAYLTLAWEVYFPALIWFRPIRLPVLLVGVFLHLGIAVTLNLPVFAVLMVLTYVFFLDRATIETARAWVIQRLRFSIFRTKVPAPASE